jgi:alkylation response protein AidB-like acyl-CoA dehydrogenase
MDFDLTEEEKLLKQTIRDFAETQIAPGARERDEAARFPTELISKMADLGLLGIMIPSEYGGAGLDAVSGAIIVEELALALKHLEGMAMVLVEQHTEIALSLTENAVVIERGRIVHRAPSDELARDPEMAERVLGLSVS